MTPMSMLLPLLPRAMSCLLDLDYILRWEDPDPQQGFFTFWVAPATLVFYQVHNLEVHIGPSQGDMTILDLTRTDEQLTANGEMIDWRWQTFGVGGHFSLRATGYTQYFRRPPLHTRVQRLSLAERGGLSFSRDT